MSDHELVIEQALRPCLSDCAPRVGIVSAFGAEADILLSETEGKQEYSINGKCSPPACCATIRS